MSEQEYRVLRPLLTDVGGQLNVIYKPGDPIVIEDAARATYLIDAGYIGDPKAVAETTAHAAITSDAPDLDDLDDADSEADSPEEDSTEEDDAPAAPASRPRRTRGAK